MPEATEGAWPSVRLAAWAEELRAVPGDFAEIGVFKGQSFRHLARIAQGQGRIAHAFDSFVGMDEPGPRDGDEYPAGKFDIGGRRAFLMRMESAGVPVTSYAMHAGWIPECFRGCDGLTLALCIVDVDQYEPTRRAIAWAWDRLAPGGYLCLDDWFQGRTTYAAGAINEWLAAEDRDIAWSEAAQLIVRR